MIPLFLGLTAVNLIFLSLLGVVTAGAVDPAGGPSALYTYYLFCGLASALLAALAHLATFTYFMATAKWLAAATDKGAIDPQRFAIPAKLNKKRALVPSMTGIILGMLAVFASAGADPFFHPVWSLDAAKTMILLALVISFTCAVAQFRLIRAQAHLMDQALAILNNNPTLHVPQT